MPSIVIVDDHQLLAETVREALRRDGFDAVVVAPVGVPAGGAGPGTADPVESTLARILQIGPELVLLDLDLGGAGSSTPLIAPLVAAGIRVLMVTGVQDRLQIAETLGLGALGYVPKADGFDALVDAAGRAMTAEGPLDPVQHATFRRELADARAEGQRLQADRDRELVPFRRLTERERETLQALSDGRSVREIADDWVVSEATVRSHVRSLLSKLGTSSQLQAVAKAARRGWLSRGDADQAGQTTHR
ncbi:helix-turn-helix transcriptional regulator [Nakamurella lactea]|uniref:helix-turn-helix transcriptional regulator n=1 Tax=Nakamurella lactea TaxID=459515 RepID=UPI0003F5CAE3|nr:response regulator transcription factor [Nakamurella lactea]